MGGTGPQEEVPDSYRPLPFRLAAYGMEPRTRRMKMVLRRLGITVEQYMTATNQPVNAFVKANPGWSQRAWEVLAVENAERWREL